MGTIEQRRSGGQQTCQATTSKSGGRQTCLARTGARERGSTDLPGSFQVRVLRAGINRPARLNFQISNRLDWKLGSTDLPGFGFSERGSTDLPGSILTVRKLPSSGGDQQTCQAAQFLERGSTDLPGSFWFQNQIRFEAGINRPARPRGFWSGDQQTCQARKSF